MPDVGASPVRKPPDPFKQAQQDAMQAVQQGAPLIPAPDIEAQPNVGPSLPGVTFQNAQTIPGNPLQVAQQANPQVGTAVLPSGQKVENVIVPKAQQQPTGNPPVGEPANIAKTVTPANQQWHDPAQPPLAQTIASAGAIPPTALVGSQQNKTDPVKEATSQPGFWQQVMDVAGKTGKTLFELLGDFASGYAGKETPTQQRLAREQQLRLQGNEIQAQKDLQSANQGFNAQQQKLQIEHDTAMQAARNDLEKQQIENSYQLRKIEIENQRQMFQLNYRWNILAQTGRTGGVEGLFGGEGK